MDTYTNLIEKYKHWKLKNTFLLIGSLALLFYLADTGFLRDLVEAAGQFGYLGVFVAGIFFVSTFTVAPASVVLFYFSKEISPVGLALIAGAGAVLGDYLIFRFLRDLVFEEWKTFFEKFGNSRFSHIFSTPYFAWLAPVLGAIIIASPFPDEIGIGLLGISKMKSWKFITLSFVLNSAGIFFVVTLANLF